MKNWDFGEKAAAYLSFSVKERWAVLVLVLLILALFFAPDYFRGSGTEIVIVDSLVSIAIAEIDSATVVTPKTKYNFAKGESKNYVHADRFFFDPNTISTDDWVRLGVKEKTAQTIQKYTEKGGKFRSPDDLKKIYGLAPGLVDQLKPFVQIAYKNNFATAKPFKFRENVPAKIMINKADSLAWEALPGIGAKLAGRIINFRNKLGGFYMISQVSEVYGLADSVFRKIEPFLINDEQPLQLLCVNSATLEELAAHPYIRKPIANAIVQYRTKNGRFLHLEELTKIHLIGPEQLAKISRYCKIQ